MRNRDKTEQLLLRHQNLTCHANFVNRELISFGYIDRYVDIFLIWCYGHLSRIDIEIDMTSFLSGVMDT
jgi:hypothetical protein